MSPLRPLCPHVVVAVGLMCFDDPWGYAVATHAWQVQGETPEQAGHGGLRRAQMVEVRFQA